MRACALSASERGLVGLDSSFLPCGHGTIKAERGLQELFERYTTRRGDLIWGWRHLAAEPVTWASLASKFAAHMPAPHVRNLTDDAP